MDIKKLFRDSYDSLSGMWGIAIGGVLIYTLISVVLNFIAGFIAGIIAVNVTPDTLSEAEAEILSQGLSTLTIYSDFNYFSSSTCSWFTYF